MSTLVRRFAAGNAVLPGASIPFVPFIMGDRGEDSSLGSIPSHRFPPLADWPVRSQGVSRGTCNAFAMAYAEELWRYRQDGKLQRLSEEHLYTAARSQPLDELVLEDDEKAELSAKLLLDGSTFLFQMRDAINAFEVVPADAAIPYDPDPRHPPNYAPVDISALTPKDGTEAFTHDIDIRHPRDTRGPQVWKSGSDEPVSERIWAALAAGTPVLAAFYLLEHPHDPAWYGLGAQLYGHIRYPVGAAPETLKIEGAHSVCIVDFQVDAATKEEMFVFRNSWGQHEFSSAPWKRPHGVRAPARGYGLITGADVDLFCWEFLHRTI